MGVTKVQYTAPQYTAACDVAAKVYLQELRQADAIKVLEAQHGVNRNSARDFIEDYRHLCRGEVFQRAMSADAMRHFISHIAATHGATGLRNAIKSLERHVQYYESGGRRTLVMRNLLREFREAASGPAAEFPDRASVRNAMRRLSTEDVRAAFAMIDQGAGQQFGAARDYFVRFAGKNYPAKRVVGVALEISHGLRATPNDFASGVNSVCFLVLRALGFPPVDAARNPVHAEAATLDETVRGGETDIDGAVAPLRQTGQGFGLNAVQRRAVELAAMKLARVELDKLGFAEVRDVSPTHPCDFLAMLNGQEWVIEVKGTTGSSPDQVLLTANELDLHRECPERSCLIVVYGIALDREQNVATGGHAAVSMPWTLSDWLLVPTAYRAVRLAGALT